jgi:phage tail protein X
VPAVRGDLVGPLALATFLRWVFAGVAIAVMVANDGAAQWEDTRTLRAPVALIAPFVALVVTESARRQAVVTLRRVSALAQMNTPKITR